MFYGETGTSTADLGVSTHRPTLCPRITVHRSAISRGASDHAPVEFLLGMPLRYEEISRIPKTMYADENIGADCLRSYERNMSAIVNNLQAAATSNELDAVYQTMTSAFLTPWQTMTSAFITPWKLHVKQCQGKFKTAHKPGL